MEDVPENENNQPGDEEYQAQEPNKEYGHGMVISYVKLDWYSTKATTDGLVITSTIEAHEGRDVAVADLPNEFLNTKNDDKTLMLFKGKLA